LPYKIDINNY